MTESLVTIADDCPESVISHRFFDSVKSQSPLVDSESINPTLDSLPPATKSVHAIAGDKRGGLKGVGGFKILDLPPPQGAQKLPLGVNMSFQLPPFFTPPWFRLWTPPLFAPPSLHSLVVG